MEGEDIVGKESNLFLYTKKDEDKNDERKKEDDGRERNVKEYRKILMMIISS